MAGSSSLDPGDGGSLAVLPAVRGSAAASRPPGGWPTWSRKA